ncbi:MAG: DUF436 family protein, partial [Desulfitobacteriaceae bacterium]
MGEKPDQRIQKLADNWRNILEEFFNEVKMRPKQILVLGCSTSEVLGQHIGRRSSPEVAEVLLPPLLEWAHQSNIFLAIQGCEHINRALV